MASPILQFKRGLFANLPGLRAGEPALTNDTFDLHVGIDSTTENNKFFGSHRYWQREDGTTSLRLRLVDKTGNVANSIHIKSPNEHTGITTYTFPSVPSAGDVLTTNASGVLSWTAALTALNIENIVIGIGTFNNDVGFATTTESTDPTTGGVVVTAGLGVGGNANIGGNLGVTGIGTFGGAVTIYNTTQSTDKDTGSLILEGGLGVEKNVNLGGNIGVTGIATISSTTDTNGNATTGALVVAGGVGIAKSVYIGTDLTVGNHLFVGGTSEFVGVVTFKGGTINIGDENTDNINVGGEFISGLVPNIDNTHDLGSVSQRWKTLNVVNVDTTNLTGTAGTITTFNSTTGTITNLTSTNVSVSGLSTFTGAIDANGDLDVDGYTELDDVNVSGTLNVTGISTFTGAIDANGNLDVDGYTELDDVNVSGTLNVVGVSTFTGAIDVNGGVDISGGETILSSATVSDLTAGRVVLAGTSGSIDDSANLTFGAGGLIVGAGGVNVTGVSTFSADLVVGGDIRVNGNDIQASDGATNITLTSNTLTTFAGDIKVTGNDIQASDGATNITMTSNTLTEVKGDLKITGNDIQSSTGTVAITLADNDVTVADDLTVQGNLYVNGSTTQVNTASITVEDRTIDLGIVNGADPASATTWDLGVLFNYNSSGAKKSAVIWEHADTRFKFASVVGADTNGTDVNTPQLTVTTFAPVEIGQLWVTDCAGTSQVISCTGTTRNLDNITVDAGTF